MCKDENTTSRGVFEKMLEGEGENLTFEQKQKIFYKKISTSIGEVVEATEMGGVFGKMFDSEEYDDYTFSQKEELFCKRVGILAENIAKTYMENLEIEFIPEEDNTYSCILKIDCNHFKDLINKGLEAMLQGDDLEELGKIKE
ncbi:MAG TPA: hypothetical protein VK031_09455 [Tissierellaceae bacterium]|nr:hypothetical protein [Tissierellaceae bacterium]